MNLTAAELIDLVFAHFMEANAKRRFAELRAEREAQRERLLKAFPQFADCFRF
jgi:hypothetical protein